MSEEVFLLPDVGEGLVEAEIVQWKVAVGDTVTLNQPLVDIETAKATVELPSPYAGTVVTLHGTVGDVMEVHKPLITFDVGGASAPAKAASNETATSAAIAGSELVEQSPAAVGEGREAVLVGYGVANEDGVATRKHRRAGRNGAAPNTPAPVLPAPIALPAPTAVASMAPRCTPPVRLYAKQHGVDLTTVAGTGRDGLITRDDVERALSGAPAPSAPRSPASTGPTTPSHFVGRDIESWSTGPKEERIPVKGVLRAMAEAMVQSSTSAPHASVWVRFDATKTMELVASL